MRETALQFALRFAQTDIRKLREGDLLNIRDDLCRHFFWKGFREERALPGKCLGVPSPDPEALSAKELTQTLADLRAKCDAHLKAWAAQRTVGDMLVPHLRSRSPWGRYEKRQFDRVLERMARVATKFPDDYALFPSGETVVTGKLVDVFLYIVTLLLQMGGADTLRICPECGKYLSKRGRRKYCSTTCLQRANKRSWRIEQKKRAEEARRKK